MIVMFEDYRRRLDYSGYNFNDALSKNAKTILDNSFDMSTGYREVFVNGQKFEARIMTDSKTTMRGGSGNYVIQFKSDTTFPAGTYIDIPDMKQKIYEKWLLMYDNDDPLFEKPIIKKCNYLLKWINYKGNIVERWVVFSDNIRLSTGYSSFQHNEINMPWSDKILLLPCDIETINIKRGYRFLIDYSEGLYGNPEAYIVSNRNVISKTNLNKATKYSGVIELLVSLHQFNENTDNKQLMIANYYKESDYSEEESPAGSKSVIIKTNGAQKLIMGMSYKKYIAEFYDDEILNDQIKPIWEVVYNDEFIDYIDYKIENNFLYIKCSYNPLLINGNILIKVKNETNEYVAEQNVKVVSMI